VAIGDTYYLCMIRVPEVCNLPLGMRWPVDVSFANDMGPASQVFQQMMKGLEKMLTV
jgi:hypothetical protein